MKSHSGEQVNLLGSCFPVKGMSYERMLYAMGMLLIPGTGNGERGTGNREQESGN